MKQFGRSGIVTGARIILALIDGECDGSVAGIAHALGISTNSARKAMSRLVLAELLDQSEPTPRSGTPPTTFFRVKRKPKSRKKPRSLPRSVESAEAT